MNLIKKKRKEKGITQQQFADKVKLSRSYIARLERGDYKDDVFSKGTFDKIQKNTK